MKVIKAKPMPSLRSDTEAEQFVAKVVLSQFDLSGFKPMRLEIAPKDACWRRTWHSPGEVT